MTDGVSYVYHPLMARHTPSDRLEKLISVAAETFVRNGFQRTQMDDIALALGVSKGTVYRSVDSKESLLAAVLEFGDTPELLPSGGRIEAASLDSILTSVGGGLKRATGRLELASAVGSAETSIGFDRRGGQVESIAIDYFQMMARHRVRIMVLDTCASEIPVLGTNWYQSGRYAVVDLWTEYLEQHRAELRLTLEGDVVARSIVELTTIWAVKMPWDPQPRPYGADMAASCASMVRRLATGEQP